MFLAKENSEILRFGTISRGMVWFMLSLAKFSILCNVMCKETLDKHLSNSLNDLIKFPCEQHRSTNRRDQPNKMIIELLLKEDSKY